MAATAPKHGIAGQTYVGGAIRVNQVTMAKPWRWLARGWHDLWAVPMIGLTYGALFATMAFAMLYSLVDFQRSSLIFVLIGGFLLVGPMLAVGLYETSRRLEQDVPIEASDVILVGVRSPGQFLLMGVVLLAIYIIWVQLALVIFRLFIGSMPIPQLDRFLVDLIVSQAGTGLLVAGTLVGAILAALTYCMTVVSIPLLMVRGVDVMTAIVVSFRAVWRNPGVMALWAGLIFVIMTLGFATAFVGLVVTFPLIGHATWHAYRELVDAEVEPEIIADVLAS